MDFTEREALNNIFCNPCIKRGSTLERNKFKYQKGKLGRKAIDRLLAKFGFENKLPPVYCKQMSDADKLIYIETYSHIKHIVDVDTFVKIMNGKALDIKLPFTDFYKKLVEKSPKFIRFMIDEEKLPELYVDCHLATLNLSLTVGAIQDSSHSKTNLYYYLKQQKYDWKK